MDKAESKNEGKVPTVDGNLCIGCGLCAQTCGDCFALGDDGKSYVKNTAPWKGCNMQDVINNCPAHAISWIEQS